MANSRWARWAPYCLFAILAVAAIVRLWGIKFGLPYDGITYDALTIEEIQEVHRALKLGAGEYTWMIGKGGLYLILFVEYGIYFAVSWLLGWVSGPREFAVQALQDPTAFYMMGRVTVALLGVATCLVVYRFARRVYDERVALGAALIGALAYYHAIFSAVINVDIGCALFLWTSLLVYSRFEETGRIRYLVGAGALGAVSVAFKFPGAIILPLLWVAILTSPRPALARFQRVKECAIVLAALVVAFTIIAPEWIPRIGFMINYNFFSLIDANTTGDMYGDELSGEIRSITVMKGGWHLRYLEHLFRGYNVALTAFAAIGMVAGFVRRNRWDLILTGLVVVFIGIMSLSDRTQAERYLLPIVPALWLLGARGAMVLGSRSSLLAAAALALIIAWPVYALSRVVVERSQLDTRVHAKQWIEAHVPAGSRILMDGMQYRFSQSPPLNLDRASVTRKVKSAAKKGESLGRGVSDLALSVYQEATSKVSGPTYEIVSTVHGLRVQPVSYYVDQCFDYIITSSMIAGRFEPGGRAREDFPNSSKFYDSLATDARVRLAHEEVAVPWHKSGPTIRVYELKTGCHQAGQTSGGP